MLCGLPSTPLHMVTWRGVRPQKRRRPLAQLGLALDQARACVINRRGHQLYNASQA
jgi:hypothetical protein